MSRATTRAAGQACGDGAIAGARRRSDEDGEGADRAIYTRTMQLRETRLCLDCEELHVEDRCPACASDAFAFLTRWVPVGERRVRRRPPPRPAPQSRLARLTRGGVTGMALVAVGRWLWQSTRPGTPDPKPGATDSKPDAPSSNEAPKR
jgi:hypothetical protein